MIWLGIYDHRSVLLPRDVTMPARYAVAQCVCMSWACVLSKLEKVITQHCVMTCFACQYLLGVDSSFVLPKILAKASKLHRSRPQQERHVGTKNLRYRQINSILHLDNGSRWKCLCSLMPPLSVPLRPRTIISLLIVLSQWSVLRIDNGGFVQFACAYTYLLTLWCHYWWLMSRSLLRKIKLFVFTV